jgi:hypothetical protein
MQVIAIHDVDDVQHWHDSPERSKFFEERGMTATPFRDPSGGSNTVAALIDTPDMETLEKALATPEAAAAAAAAAKHDGVHVDTLRVVVAGSHASDQPGREPTRRAPHDATPSVSVWPQHQIIVGDGVGDG